MFMGITPEIRSSPRLMQARFPAIKAALQPPPAISDRIPDAFRELPVMRGPGDCPPNSLPDQALAPLPELLSSGALTGSTDRP